MILRHFRAVCSTARWCLPNKLRKTIDSLFQTLHLFHGNCKLLKYHLYTVTQIYGDICVLFTWVYRSLIYCIFLSWLLELMVDVKKIFPGIPLMKRIDGGLPHSNPQGPRPRSVAPGFGWLGFKMNFMKRKIGWSVDPKWQTSMDPKVGPYQL